MDSSKLTAEQVEILARKAAEMNAWLYELHRRMEQRGFPGNDELYRLVVKTHNAMSELRMLLHYMSCDKSKRVWNGYGHPQG